MIIWYSLKLDKISSRSFVGGDPWNPICLGGDLNICISGISCIYVQSLSAWIKATVKLALVTVLYTCYSMTNWLWFYHDLHYTSWPSVFMHGELLN